MISQEKFLEHAKVFDHYYGTSAEWVQKKLISGVDVILEIDWQGAEQVRPSFPESRSIFILPPSLGSLRDRLEKRNQDHPEVIAKRLQKAALEMSHYDEFDYLVVNEDFNTACQQLQSLVLTERLRTARQKQSHQELVNQLLG